MSEKPKISTETPSASNKSVDFVDKISETIGKITSTIRGKISSVFGGLGNLLKKGFNKLFGEPEKKAEDKDTSDEKPDDETEKPDEDEKPEDEPETANEKNSEKLTDAFNLKLASLTSAIHDLKEAKTITDEQGEKIRKSLEEAQENMDGENPDMEEVAKKLDSTTDELFNLIKPKKLNIKQGELTEEENKAIQTSIKELEEQSTTENIRKAVTAIIKKAAGEGIKTIVIPALGVEADNISPQESAKAIREGMMDAIEDLVKLKGVTLVIEDEETMKAFKKEFKLEKKKPSDEKPENKSEKEKKKAKPKPKKKTNKVSDIKPKSKPESELQEAA